VGWIADYLVAQGAGSWHADGADHPHEATYLALDAGKARADLGWTPHWSLETALDNILAWHRAQAEGEDMQALSLSQIDKYSAAAGVS
jgi:CDP-glucose 4,6-dehydratase